VDLTRRPRVIAHCRRLSEPPVQDAIGEELA
jgi:hypothetical protein